MSCKDIRLRGVRSCCGARATARSALSTTGARTSACRYPRVGCSTTEPSNAPITACAMTHGGSAWRFPRIRTARSPSRRSSGHFR